MKKEALYITIENYILNKIKNGEYSMGDLIPSERELTKLFNSSRSTVNKALFNLTNRGYLYRTPGRGSFVRSTISKDDISFEKIIKKSLLARDLSRIRVNDPINGTNQRFFIVGPQDTELLREDYERKIDRLDYEGETVGLSIVTTHKELLNAVNLDELSIENLSNIKLFESNEGLSRKFIVKSNKKIDISKRTKLDIPFNNFPIQMDFVIEKEDGIILMFEIFLQSTEFSFSF